MGVAIGTGTGRRGGLRWAGRATGVAVAVVVGLGVTAGIAPGVASAKPSNPSDTQIQQAKAAADAAAAQVGRISAQLAQAQAAIDAAHAQANIALDRFQAKQAEFEQAQVAAQAADAAATQAQADLADARTAVAGFARDSYMSGSTSSRITAMLTSGSPSQMLERAALLDAAGDHRSDVLDQVTVVEQQAEQAQDAAATALATADQLQKDAADQLAHAEQLEAGARQQASAFEAQQAQLQAQLATAQQTLAGLQGQRAAADAASAAEAATPAPAPAPAADPEPVDGDDSGAGSASGSVVETAIAAAERYIGTRYAWGGGSLSGPSMGYGVDAGVVGFDCSGLTRYAYYQAGISIARNSSAQYTSLPHVSRANLQRGDLVFWATSTSNPSTIHHVAIYLGNNRILEAPESGKTVRETSMRWSGFIGGARPGA